MTLPSSIKSGYRQRLVLANPSGLDTSQHSLRLLAYNDTHHYSAEFSYDDQDGTWALETLFDWVPGCYSLVVQRIHESSGDPIQDELEQELEVTKSAASIQFDPVYQAQARLNLIQETLDAIASDPASARQLEGLTYTAQNIPDLERLKRSAKRALNDALAERNGTPSGGFRVIPLGSLMHS